MSTGLSRVPSKLYDSTTGWDPDGLIAFGASEERDRNVRLLREKAAKYRDRKPGGLANPWFAASSALDAMADTIEARKP